MTASTTPPSAVRIERVELRRIALPLVTPFRTSFGVETERDILLVRVVGDAGGASIDGWGECVALSEPSYSPEYVDGAQHVIVHHLLPRLMAAGPILEAAFLRDPGSRLLLAVFAYVLLTKGMFWVGMPYTFRDAVTWATANDKRWRLCAIGGLAYGVLVLICAVSFWRGH